jgi:hypothetical protein
MTKTETTKTEAFRLYKEILDVENSVRNWVRENGKGSELQKRILVAKFGWLNEHFERRSELTAWLRKIGEKFPSRGLSDEEYYWQAAEKIKMWAANLD